MKKIAIGLLFASQAYASNLTPEESNLIGTMRLIYQDVPLMTGEYLNEDGEREYKGTIMSPKANTTYTNKKCVYAGFYGQCMDEKKFKCVWYGEIKKQCATVN